MEKALAFYAGNKRVGIPRLLPFSTQNVTAMEYMKGCKVTDAAMPLSARKQHARELFNTILCAPVFAREKQTIFHGDPHAGNILAMPTERKGKTRVGLVDWSLSDTLSITFRVNLLKLLLGVLVEDERRINEAVAELSMGNPGDDAFVAKVATITQDVMQSQAYEDGRLMEKGFLFIDQMLVSGIRFPRELLLFRKSDFTLEGVIGELDSDFDMTSAMIGTIVGHCIADLPKRISCLLFPIFDKPHRYKSLMSNKDIQIVMIHVILNYIEIGCKKGEDLFRKLIKRKEKYIKEILGTPNMIFRLITALGD